MAAHRGQWKVPLKDESTRPRYNQLKWYLADALGEFDLLKAREILAKMKELEE